MLVARYKSTRSAEFFAGMELSLLHLGLSLLSLSVRRGWVGSLRPWARQLLTIAQWLLPFGSDKGAMLVEVTGTGSDGQPTEASWRLNADANRGPYVPVLAALAMVRRWRDGREPGAGAHICSGLLDLMEFDQDFEALGLATTVN